MNIKLLKRAFNALLLPLLAILTPPVAAQEAQFFRIGTGETLGVYYPLGGALSTAVSAPPGSRPCEQGGACGVPGLIAVAISSLGSVANVRDISAGTLDSGFTQSDIAYWAYTGTESFTYDQPLDNLRLIANLYPENLHLVVRRDAEVASVSDLRNMRVSLGPEGSGTLTDARHVLEAFGVEEAEIKPLYLKPGEAADAMIEGRLDAFFAIGGYPHDAVVKAAAGTDIALISLTGRQAADLANDGGFYSISRIPAGAYPGVNYDTVTLAVQALWVTSAEQDQDLIYDLTAALWNDVTRKLLDIGHPKGSDVRLKSALIDRRLPLHPGAERFYREVGALNRAR